MGNPNYYCSVDGVWRRTPCVHEVCARLDFKIPLSQMKLGKKERQSQPFEDDRSKWAYGSGGDSLNG